MRCDSTAVGVRAVTQKRSRSDGATPQGVARRPVAGVRRSAKALGARGVGLRAARCYVRLVPSGQCRGAAARPIWSRDGRELFFRTGRRIFAVPVDTTRGFTVGKPVMLFERPYLVDLLTGFDYDVAPDGRFLMIKPSEDEQAPARLNVVLNWVKKLKRRVPAGR